MSPKKKEISDSICDADLADEATTRIGPLCCCEASAILSDSPALKAPLHMRFSPDELTNGSERTGIKYITL